MKTRILALGLLALSAAPVACTKGDGGAKPAVKPAPRPVDPAIAACKNNFAGIQGLGTDIDVPAVWQKCMVATGRDSGLCDTTRMIHAEIAVCIAQAHDMFATGQVLAHLEVNPNPGREVIFWSISSTDNVEHAAVDAITGELLVRMRDGQELKTPVQGSPSVEQAEVDADTYGNATEKAAVETSGTTTNTPAPKVESPMP